MFRQLITATLAATLALGFTTQGAAARSFARPPAAATEDGRVRPSAQRAALKKVLTARRARNLAAFKAYVTAGVYPHNQLTPGELNIWIDDDGHRCAAASMIWASGEHALVEETAATDNFIRLANVTEGPLLDWILTSGLTHDEVVLIQRPMMGRDGKLHRPGIRPEPAIDWRIAADRSLRLKYDGILEELARSKAASLDAALDALMAHPELVTQLLQQR